MGNKIIDKSINIERNLNNVSKPAYLNNGKNVIRRIEESKKDSNRNESYKTLVQANTHSIVVTNEKSLKDNSDFIINCKY